MSKTDIQGELKNLVDTVSPKVEAAALVAAERGGQFAGVAAERGAQWAEIAAERGHQLAETVAERSAETAERLGQRIPDETLERLPDSIASRIPRKSRKGRKLFLLLGGLALAGGVAYVLSQRKQPIPGPTPVPAPEANPVARDAGPDQSTPGN